MIVSLFMVSWWLSFSSPRGIHSLLTVNFWMAFVSPYSSALLVSLANRKHTLLLENPRPVCLEEQRLPGERYKIDQYHLLSFHEVARENEVHRWPNTYVPLSLAASPERSLKLPCKRVRPLVSVAGAGAAWAAREAWALTALCACLQLCKWVWKIMISCSKLF